MWSLLTYAGVDGLAATYHGALSLFVDEMVGAYNKTGLAHYRAGWYKLENAHRSTNLNARARGNTDGGSANDAVAPPPSPIHTHTSLPACSWKAAHPLVATLVYVC